MSPTLALALLALLHSTMVGLRNSFGRDGRIYQTKHKVRGALTGLLFGALIIGALGALAFALLPEHAWRDVDTAAAAALPVYVVFTGAIAATFVLYAIPHVEARALVSVAVFGPFTLIHPWVCVAGTALSIATATHTNVRLLILLAGFAMVALEPALGRLGFGRPKPLVS